MRDTAAAVVLVVVDASQCVFLLLIPHSIFNTKTTTHEPKLSSLLRTHTKRSAIYIQ